MQIFVRVIPNAKKAEVIELDSHRLRVKINAPAHEGKANKRLLEILSEYFHVARNAVSIVRGAKAQTKIVEIAR